MRQSFVRAFARAAAAIAIAALAFASTSALGQSAKPATTKPAAKPAAFDASACLGCHEPIKMLGIAGRHKILDDAIKAKTATAQ